MAVAGPREHAVIDCVAIFYKEGKGGENYRKKKQVQMSDRQGRKKTRQVQGEYLVSCKLRIKA